MNNQPDDRVGDIGRLGVLNPLIPPVPAMSSVLTNDGNTIENFTPAERYSSLAESVNATTACLLAQ